MRTVPLVAYWTDKAYPSGAPSPDFRAPPVDPADYRAWKIEYDRYFEPFATAERQAWAAVCAEAVSGKIVVRAFRHVIRPEPRAWYPDHPENNVREIIPPEFFSDPGIYIGPLQPVVIYYTDNRMGGPQNAPWSDPVVTYKPEPTRKRGRKPGVDWPAFKQKLFEKIGADGYPNDLNVKGWRGVSDVGRWLQDLADREPDRGSEAPTLRWCNEKADEMLREWREQNNSF